MSRDQVTNISVNVLKVHPSNTIYFDDIEGEAYERFKASIKEDGIITPLIIAPDMTIISGHQRYHAAKDLGIELLPVIIRDKLVDEDERMKKLLAANFGREKNNPVKQGRVIEEYERLMGVDGKPGPNSSTKNSSISKEDVAKQFGVSVDTLNNLKKLSKLSPELQSLIEDGDVKYTTALKVWTMLTNEEQTKFIYTMGKEQVANLTAKDTKELMLSYDKVKRELAEEKSKAPEVVEVIPNDVKEKLLQLEETKEKLEELQRESEKIKDFGKSKREIELEIQALRDKRSEQINVLGEMEIFAEKARKKQSQETISRRFIDRVGVATDDLKKQKYSIEELFESLRRIGNVEKNKLIKEAKFLREMADMFEEMANSHNAYATDGEIIEGDFVNGN